MIDVITPIYNVDLKIFKQNIFQWFNKLPINNLIIGIGKENKELGNILSNYRKVKIIYQYNYKTLGYCLQELIKKVNTPYFIYFHSDVSINEYWFNSMWNNKVKGIIESLKDNSFDIQPKRFRSYSGAQLIYTDCLKDLNWQDDYIYTSEDLLIQNHIISNGFNYIKLPIYHTHFTTNNIRTKNRKTILNWQYKALIKYGIPEKHLLSYLLKTVKAIKKEFGYKIKIKKEINRLNPDSNWLTFYNENK